MTIQIGIGASNRDKKIWGEDADEFKVERFLHRDSSEDDDGMDERKSQKEGEEKEKLPGIYGGLMTFMGGNRSCMYVFSLLSSHFKVSNLLHCFTVIADSSFPSSK